MGNNMQLTDCPKDVLLQIFTHYRSALGFDIKRAQSRLHALLILSKQLYPIIQRILYDVFQYSASSYSC